jgi:NADH-quinone oxidoreductase subunit L
MSDVVWLVPLLPLAGFAVLVAFGRRLGDPAAGWLATLLVVASFVTGALILFDMLGEPEEERRSVETVFTWIPAGSLHVDVGFLVDPLSITMVLFVTGVGSLIHLYSVGYMHGDDRFPTFFAYLNLFTFSMLVLVLADNLLLTFLGWEGVGVCSYLLISFWFTRETAAVAGKKAFVTNRVGDAGYLVAMFLVFATIGTLDFAGEDGFLAQAGDMAEPTAMAVALLLFVGAAGKSAQLPLYVWLPDAMEGPTPVSALIHAATMVTSGVYLMARINPVFEAAPDALTVIAFVGVATALVAATVAVAQTDIKRVLAYSTVSQLGFMFMAVGSGAYVAAVFHMVTHAFFKALLFLGAGSVIHGVQDEQDMRRMGALRPFMPWTAATFIVGWLAIAGVPPFAGFWSKDEILASLWEMDDYGRALWAVALLTAGLTAYYMSRQVFLVFFGEPRWGAEAGARTPEEPEPAAVEPAAGEGAGTPAGHGAGTPHESPWVMLGPLVLLAGLAAVGGGLNLPFTDVHFLEDFLHPVFGEGLHELEMGGGEQFTLGALAVVAAAAGIAAAFAVYLRGVVDPGRVEPDLLRRGWRYDEALAALFGGPGRAAAQGLKDVVDGRGIDGAVNGLGTLVRAGGRRLRVVQTGFVRNYALGMTAGAVLLLAFFALRMGS